MTTIRHAGAAAHGLTPGTYKTPPEKVPEVESERRIRPAGIEIRDLDASSNLRELSGIAVPYGVRADIGWFVEEFAPGSLSRSIEESPGPLPLLLFHDAQAFPIGAAKRWEDGTDALEGLWRLDGSEVAQRAAQLARDGLLSYMSIRFQPIRSAWTTVADYNPDLGPDHKDSVVRQEARLLETSLVSTPAYASAAVSFVRASRRNPLTRDARGTELKGWREYLDRVRTGPAR